MIDRDRELLFDDGDRRIAARPEIVASWRRSRSSGVDPSRPLVKFASENAAHHLTRSVVPALTSMADLMVGSRTGLLLSDRLGRVVWRWADSDGLYRLLERHSVVNGVHLDEASVGTNGVGTALEVIRPVRVVGIEHYIEALHRFSCVAIPLRHPATNRVEGALSLTCLVKDTNPLMQPTLRRMAREVEAHLFGQSSVRDRELLGHFLAARRRSRDAVVVMNDEIVIANRAGTRLGLDHRTWWNRAEQDMVNLEEVTLPVKGEAGTAEQTVAAHVRTLREGRSLVGLVFVVPAAAISPTRRSAEPTRVRGGSAVDEARSILDRCGRLIVHGESGTGKATLLRELGFSVLDVGDASAGLAGWLERARRMLAGPAGLGLIHLDVLDDRGCRAMASLLDLSSTAVPIAATWTGPLDEASRAQQALVDRFGAEAVEVPSLCSRPDEILPLLAHGVESILLRADRAPARLTQAAAELLKRHRWPGNIRQLRQFARWLCAQDRALVDVGHLPQQLQRACPRTNLTGMEVAEAEAIRDALLRRGGNKVAAAAALGISRSSLYRKIRVYGLNA